MLALEHDGFQSDLSGEEGLVPPPSSLAVPLLLYQSRLGGEERRFVGNRRRQRAPQSPLPHAWSLPLASSVV